MPELIAKSGKKGRTYFVRYAGEDLKSTTLSDSDKRGVVDVLLAGKMTVLPESIHPDTGLPYGWQGKTLLEATFAKLPQLTKPKLALLRRIVGLEDARVLTGGYSTHDAGLRLTAQLVAFECSGTEIEQIVRALLPLDYSGNSLEELPGWIRSAREKGFDERSPRGGRQRAPSAPGLLLTHLAADGVTFSHDALKQPFMSVPQEGGGSLHYRIGSRTGSDILAHRFYLATGQALKESALRDAVNLLTAKAVFNGPQETFHSRLAREGDSIVIDLGTSDGSVVRITPEGFSVLAASPVKFVRPAGTLPLPHPSRRGGLSELKELLGLSQETFTLVLAFVLNCLRPGGPYMFLLVEGEQGSGKSFLCTILRRIIDPNLADKVRIPDNERELMVLANEMFLLTFDNASGMRANISDLLCSLSTGGGFVSRKLYTDADLHIASCTPMPTSTL